MNNNKKKETYIKAKRGKTTVFVECNFNETVGTIKKRLADIVEQEENKIALLKDSSVSEASASSPYIALNDSQILSHTGIPHEGIIYYVYLDENQKWEEVNIPKPDLSQEQEDDDEEEDDEAED